MSVPKKVYQAKQCVTTALGILIFGTNISAQTEFHQYNFTNKFQQYEFYTYSTKIRTSGIRTSGDRTIGGPPVLRNPNLIYLRFEIAVMYKGSPTNRISTNVESIAILFVTHNWENSCQLQKWSLFSCNRDNHCQVSQQVPIKGVSPIPF